MGTRATVMLEFAFVAPLVAAVALFATDFTRILRTEQQLEIANRLAADVEAHVADYNSGGKTPSSVTKNVGKRYLVGVAHVVDSTEHVYMKGGRTIINNPISVAIDWVASFVDGSRYGDDSMFLKILGKLFGAIMDFLTFRTVRYLTEVIPHDREIKISTAAYIPTILPSKAYEWLGVAEPGKDGIGVCQFVPDLEADSPAAVAGDIEMKTGKRHRVYCYMPVIDSAPVAPQTYVRKLMSWAKTQKWAKGILY
jgi:hypothetical protein